MKNKLLVILLVCALMFVAVGCNHFQGDNKPDDENQGNVNENEGNVDENEGENSGDVEKPVIVTKDALNAELALEVTEQGDYTEASYNAYLEKLAAAKVVVADEAATQDSVDKAAADLTAARNNLKVRSISAVENTNKEIKLVPGDVREITLADYINDNGLSKVTYEIKSNHEAIVLGDIADGKFTVTAGDVSEYVDAKVSIVAYYDGVQKLEIEFSVKITNDIAPTLNNTDVVEEFDVFHLGGEFLVVDFAENVNNPGNLALTYSAKHDNDTIALDGSTYNHAFSSYTDEYSYITFTVTVSYVANGVEGSLEYTYKLGLKDTGAYNVVNGGFNNGLEGWTINTTEGELPFGGIDNRDTFWGQGFPMFNVGSYFSGIADGASEASQGTLASSYFTAKGAYATFMLGAAGNSNVYITIENKAGDVLAIFRNTKFSDLPSGYTDEEYHAMIGNTVFALNFVTYKVDISAYAGQEIRFVLNDYASSGFGFACFDELVTYYASETDVPENATLAENLLANKTDLNIEIGLEVAEQGDYTLDSFNAYQEKLAAAKALVNDIAVTQATVDAATAALAEARQALTVRPIEAKADANKSFRITSGNTKGILVADFVNVNGLSNITYRVSADNSLIVPGEVVDGEFTIYAGNVTEATTVTVSLVVSYKGEEKLTVELTVQITNDVAPTLHYSEIVKPYDVYTLENKNDIAIDLAANVDNAGNLPLSFTVNGVAVDSIYTFTFGQYTETVSYETFTVVVTYVANGETGTLEYIYKLAMTDTTAYRLVNGGFENGLDGWTVVGNIGNVSSDKNYWVNDPESQDGFAFGMDGDKMFSAYAPGASEGAVGTLTSPVFKINKLGYITFKLGAAKDGNYVYVDIVDANTKEILARYYNGLWADRTDDQKSGCTLIPYYADLGEFEGREVFVRISDNAGSGYGLFFVDSFVTYYEYMGQFLLDYNEATPVSYDLPGTIYDVFNGGFEMGDNQGWWNDGEPGKVTGANAFFNGREYGKNGNFLYSGVEDHMAGNGREGNRGVLTSSAFEIGGTGYISYMLGGGGNALCYVQVIDAVTGEILARYRQQEMDEAVLKTYVADLSAYIGRTVRFQVVDQAGWDWGCVSFDNLVTYHTTIPDGILANDIKGDLKHTIENGSFENGLEGWHQNIWEAGAHNTLGWVESSEHDAGWYTKNDDRKDGNFLFTFCRPDGTNCENTKGELVSSTFSLKQGAFVAFKFGGAGTREVRVELCRADGSVIATFYNEAPGKINTEMHSYYYQYNGPEVNCFFRVVDDSTGNYGCFVVDAFEVNLDKAPEGYIAAIQ